MQIFASMSSLSKNLSASWVFCLGEFILYKNTVAKSESYDLRSCFDEVKEIMQ